MDKDLVLKKYKKTEEKLLISKFLDKIDSTEKTNKITCTDFYNESEIAILKNVINIINFKNYVFYGGYSNCDRSIIIVYPEKMKNLFENNSFKFDTVLSVIRIIIPKENRANFTHSVYLGGIIKLGIKREKIGDILVYDEGADIIIKNETKKFLYSNLPTLTRFENADISEISIEELVTIERKFNDIKLITSSLRLDNMVAELARTSRSKADEILNEERVFINYQNETKPTKIVKEHDVISIRGKGKFIIDEIAGNTRKGNYVINIKQYM